MFQILECLSEKITILDIIYSFYLEDWGKSCKKKTGTGLILLEWLICLLVCFFHEQITYCLLLSIFSSFRSLKTDLMRKRRRMFRGKENWRWLTKLLSGNLYRVFSNLCPHLYVYINLLQEKAETEVGKFGPSLCFRARPLPEFYRERETSKKQIKKVSLWLYHVFDEKKNCFQALCKWQKSLFPRQAVHHINSSLHYCRLQRCTLSLLNK